MYGLLLLDILNRVGCVDRLLNIESRLLVDHPSKSQPFHSYLTGTSANVDRS